MKTQLFLSLLLLSLNTVHAQKPEGSFIFRAAQHGETVRTTEDPSK